ncbi:synaptogenesis protein syg-2 [Parasteatoda tepidariorum]|uniref:synaptogenesis protein syg-2 n=1 Tax=Parasteatoda tepidariorum TaxID=114398 RepID=UPI00077FD424|nr:synaptogenesis protein syg-2 [Parasteatoda tepidariorum]
MLFLFLIGTLGTFQNVMCLKLREIVVPAVVIKGDSVWLNCTYDLGNETLYSIKWHKNNVEFYRYLPEDRPPGQKYDLNGIHLDLDRTDRGNIFMPYTDVDSEGIYRCEVSTEAPNFQTVKAEREMRIYVNPSSKPIIKGTKPYYAPGDLVNVTCVSAPSRPAAILKWWINGEEARTNRMPSIESPDGLFTSMLTLKFIAKPSNFWEGKMKLQCEAIISQAHTLRSEEIIISNSGTYIATGAYDQQKDGPSIDGGKHVYNVGDLVDINCTAAPSQPPAELHWYINDKEVRPEHLLPRKPLVFQNGLESPVLGLKFEVKQRHFQKHEMRLRCTATLSEVKRMTSEPLEAVLSEQHKSDLHVDLNMSSVSNKSTWSPYTIHPLCCIIILLVSRTFF